MTKEKAAPTLAEAANTLVLILSVIVQMSDEVEKQASVLDRQVYLLRMQRSIQKNASRIKPYVKVVLDTLEEARSKVH